MRPFHGLAIGAAFAFTLWADGQNTVTVSSMLAKHGAPVSANCRAEAKVWRDVLTVYPHPDSWKWFILCDDAAWNLYLQRTDHSESSDFGASITIYASTDLENGVTILRGATLLHPDNRDASPEQVIAHELAHIVLHSQDEAKVEAQVRVWVRAQKSASAIGINHSTVHSGD